MGSHHDRRVAALRFARRDQQRVGGRGAQRAAVEQTADRPQQATSGKRARVSPGRRSARHLGQLHAAGIGKRQPTHVLAGRRLVGEALAVDGGWRPDVIGVSEIAPDTLAALAAELALGLFEGECRVQLATAALAEDSADQRGGRDDVAAGPVLGSQRLPDRRVLTRHLGRVEPGLGDVLVDAGDVVGDVLAKLIGLRFKSLWAIVALALQVLLRVGGVRPHLLVHLAVGRRSSRERGQLAPPGVAQHIHEEEPILGARVTEAEHRPARVSP